MRKNLGFSYREQIGRASAGRSVLDHLAAAYSHSTRDRWAKRLEVGEITLDDAKAHGGEVLRAGQWLVWNRPPWTEPEAPADFAVLYRDRDLVAVAKPSGLPTLPGGGFLENTLLFCVRRLHPEAAPVHRLGRFTSGLVLFARSSEAAARVKAGWRTETRKVYRALIEGVPERDELDVEVPIGEVPHAILGTIHAANPNGKESSSRVRLIESRGANSLVEVEITTGRPHQIRIHMAAAGHPLVGDPIYPVGGVPDPSSTALPGDPGYRLHSARLTLVHPLEGRRLDLFCAPPPCLRSRVEAKICGFEGSEAIRGVTVDEDGHLTRGP